MTARWAAVVVNYEAGPLLLQCVRAVLDDASAGAVELVVVDNGSSDGSVAALERELPEVQVVRAPGNLGYARAANLGIAATDAPVVAVLNPDVTVAAGTAGALVGRIERDPVVGAVGPRVRDPGGADYPSARRLPSVAVAAGHGALGLWWRSNPFTARYRELDADPAQSRAVDWCSGAAIWLRRAALDQVGGWDERYFMYMEDVDLCWRLRRAGWEIVYDPAGAVVHVQGTATARRPYRMLLEHHRSAWRFTRVRLRGARAALLPFAGVFLAVRLLAAIAEHAIRATRAVRPSRPSRPPHASGAVRRDG
jgi:N-acetylglucosaminyl-diphospho-decaprenol L-rhamnosyltransferase